MSWSVGYPARRILPANKEDAGRRSGARAVELSSAPFSGETASRHVDPLVWCNLMKRAVESNEKGFSLQRGTEEKIYPESVLS